jgi:hypothetical protein
LGDNTHEVLKKLTFSLNKARLLYVYDCAFMCRSLMKTSCITDLLTSIPCLPP